MDPTLQHIMDQFKELKNDISDIIEEKVGNCMNTIAQGLKTDLNGLRNEVNALESMVNVGKTEMEGRLEGIKKGDRYSGTTETALPVGHRGHTERTRGPISSGGHSSRSCRGGGPMVKYTTVTTDIRRRDVLGGVQSTFDAAAVKNNWTHSEIAAHF